MNHYVKYGLLSAAVVGTLAWLAVGGIKDGQTYFKTIPELKKMGDQAQAKRLRVFVHSELSLAGRQMLCRARGVIGRGQLLRHRRKTA